MAEKPYMVLESRFEAPPEYVAQWLTDFRPDDGRWFGRDGALEVHKEGRQTRIEGPHPMGWQKGVLTVETATRWSARTEMLTAKGGSVKAVGHVVETVRPEGSGTLHRADLSMDGKTFGMRLMSTLMKPMVKRELKQGFAKMKAEMEAAYKAGKPPTE